MKKELIYGGFLVLALLIISGYNLGHYQSQKQILDNLEVSPTSPNNAVFYNTQNSQAASITLSPTTVAQHSTTQDCWLIISNKVYAVTNYLNLHPGGAARIIPYCGKDATVAFVTQGGEGSHTNTAVSILSSFLLGDLNSTILNTNTTTSTQSEPQGADANTSPVPTQQTTPSANQTTTLDLSPTEIAKHNSSNDCWIIISNNVYAVTSFLNLHPGGAGEIIPYCGKDATLAFNTQGGQGKHSQTANSELAAYFLGPVNGQTTTENINNVQNAPTSLPQTSDGREHEFEDDD